MRERRITTLMMPYRYALLQAHERFVCTECRIYFASTIYPGGDCAQARQTGERKAELRNCSRRQCLKIERKSRAKAVPFRSAHVNKHSFPSSCTISVFHVTRLFLRGICSLSLEGVLQAFVSYT